METLENDYALVSKEVLSSMGIKNIFYEFPGGITCLLRPLYLEVGRWICTASAELSVTGFIAVNETKYAVHSERTAGLDYPNTWIITFEQPVDITLQQKIIEYKKTARKSEKRSEQRYEIGMKNWKEFLLEKPDVTLKTKTQKIRCILNNVSVHGALLTGEAAAVKKYESGIFLCCSFVSPSEHIIQEGLCVNTQYLDKGYCRYSIQFISPISFSWQKRVQAFSENAESEF